MINVSFVEDTHIQRVSKKLLQFAEFYSIKIQDPNIFGEMKTLNKLGNNRNYSKGDNYMLPLNLGLVNGNGN